MSKQFPAVSVNGTSPFSSGAPSYDDRVAANRKKQKATKYVSSREDGPKDPSTTLRALQDRPQDRAKLLKECTEPRALAPEDLGCNREPRKDRGRS